MSRGGYREGAGRPPRAGMPQTERVELVLTEAEIAEIDADRPDDVGRMRWIIDAALAHLRGRRLG